MTVKELSEINPRFRIIPIIGTRIRKWCKGGVLLVTTRNNQERISSSYKVKAATTLTQIMHRRQQIDLLETTNGAIWNKKMLVPENSPCHISTTPTTRTDIFGKIQPSDYNIPRDYQTLDTRKASQYNLQQDQFQKDYQSLKNSLDAIQTTIGNEIIN